MAKCGRHPNKPEQHCVLAAVHLFMFEQHPFQDRREINSITTTTLCSRLVPLTHEHIGGFRYKEQMK
jgi:hypothetical protein